MISENDQLVKSLNNDMAIELPEASTWDTIRNKLYGFINHLIDENFEKLMMILYRIDVHEDKLRNMLNANPATDAGLVIADLIMERQVQKIKTRQDFSQRVNNNDISEDEKW
ncbi:MAG: hypothetical protein ABIX01_12260 [Chitinophagaceae bacterium]